MYGGRKEKLSTVITFIIFIIITCQTTLSLSG
jgi:hypothetical protein